MTKGLKMPELSTAPDSPASGKRLIYPKSDGWYGKDSAGSEIKISGATNLSDLLDVDITTPADGDFQVYNATTSKWENGKTNGTVFGCSFAHDEETTAASNSTNTYSTFETLSAGTCSANKHYRIGVFILWAASVTNQSFDAIITVQEGTGTETTVGQMLLRANNAGQQYSAPASGFFYYVPTQEIAITIRLKFRIASGTAYINYGGLEWWRAEL